MGHPSGSHQSGHHLRGAAVDHSQQRGAASSSLGAQLSFASSLPFAASPAVPQNIDPGGGKMTATGGGASKTNSLGLQSAGNHCNYSMQLGATSNLSPTAGVRGSGSGGGHCHPGAITEEETSLIHRYNGQGRQARLLQQDHDTEEIIVETDLSSCDSPVRQIFCQSGSSLDDEDDYQDQVDAADEVRLISPVASERENRLQS